MSIAIHPEAVAEPQSVRSTVSRLTAGFQHMQSLGAELATLDAISQDIRHTQAIIRRDVANAVLQTAFSVKTSQDLVPKQGEAKASSEAAQTAVTAQVPDQWAKRVLRWADQLGRDLFGLPSTRPRTAKQNRTLLRP